MAQNVALKAADGHSLDAYVAEPAGTPRAALVVVQEIFGVNRYIREVSDRFAAEGYVAIAPALLDRYERGVDLGYEGADMEKAMSFVPKLNLEWHLADVAAAVEHARTTYGTEVAVVGYCLGGSLAWLAAAQLPIQAAVGYYGGHIIQLLHQAPKVPVMLHFGAEDAHIPLTGIEKIREAYPQVPVYVYEGAGHGFNCDKRSGYNPGAAQLALERTLGFLAEHLHTAPGAKA